MAELSKFFIDRPIFAAVISFVIVLVGGLALPMLPVAQYPEITPPTVQVTATYPGASSTVVAETVAAPIEQQVVGVEKMLYMSSQCTNDGVYSLTVTFEVGANLDDAQVQVQNRVNLALPQLPDVVKQTGVSVKKKSPSILLCVNLYSPNGSRDQLYLSNYGTINLTDEFKQIPGVGDVSMFGQQDYSMRIWLDPNKVAARGLTASDVVAALREQNVQVAAGSLARPPVPSGQPFQYALTTLGRLTDPEQFENIILKTGVNGQLTRLKDVVSDARMASTLDGGERRLGGIELGAKNEDTGCTLDGQPSVGLSIFQQPGSNALQTAKLLKARLEELKANFPAGVDAKIAYDTTPFIQESIWEVVHALRDAILLVAIVVLLFLQTWRATIIPLIAVPVAIVGTFAVMAGLGFSLNNLSLLGLVLAIGIVVDDAIVVVEAVEHHLHHGLSPKEATRKAMDEVANPIVSISLVLMAVFIPCAFITGITGMFFREFAVTVAVSTFFSAVNSLTLSPALCGLLLRKKEDQTDFLSVAIQVSMGWFFALFNQGFDSVSSGYASVVRWSLRLAVVALAVYGGLLYLTYLGFTTTPVGFVPLQDKGYLVVDLRLPDSASLERTKAVMAQIDRIALGDKANPSEYPGIHGVASTLGIPGNSVLQNANGSNFGAMFVVLDEFHHRGGPEGSADAIAAKLRAEIFRKVDGGVAAVFGAPAVDGLGNAGGFKLMVRDRADQGLVLLQKAAEDLSAEGNKQPQLTGLFTPLRAETPQYFVEVDRTKCKAMGVPLSEVFLTLQTYLGGYYTNDFNQFGRTWQVNIQADPAFRLKPEDIGKLRVRNVRQEIVPLASVVNLLPNGGPAMVTRYNGITAAAVNGAGRPGIGSGDMIRAVEQSAAKTLPQGTDFQWTELTLLQIKAGNTAVIVFAVAVLLVYLLLAAQYESISLPWAVILVVPMCLLCAVAGVRAAGMDLNIFVQIGLVVLVGLASKNAILIVEFAKEKRTAGAAANDAVVEACRLRLRPIIMTSFAFILGVVPLAIAEGAGAEMRRTLGISVLTGMLGVTIFGIFLTPVFYYVAEVLFGSRRPLPLAVVVPPENKPAAPH